MKFKADLHIHSRFSRATSKTLDVENLYIAALLKGITVLATGDITHPQWFEEVREKLIPAEQGLFRLKDELADLCNKQVPESCRQGKVRFMLVSEISSIYKKNGKTRKIHNLVFLPDFESVKKFNHRLDKIGNIKSDGRPILGLDARNLLEILLETSDQGFCIPAHIWTPWFSVFGSKSGFDTLEECFEDLTDHIFAAETGLSSDPKMNWRVSGLDGITLVSNSDAHSPMKLGREANLFQTELTYNGIKNALKTGDPEKFLGTLEFYPEEGKYHLDGHRKCNVCFTPQQTLKAKGICPVCKRAITIGVLYRVEELADRPDGQKPEKNHPFYSIVPLTDILSDIMKVGPNSKKVQFQYHNILKVLGNELSVLHDIDLESIDKADVPLLTESIRRMRTNKIELIPGYDGEFGKIKIFNEDERETLLGQKKFLSLPVFKKPNNSKKSCSKLKSPKKDYNKEINVQKTGDLKLNSKQKQVVEHYGGPILIVAGPGTGKTFTITQRIAWLINNKNVSEKNILAVTFTNKAATEMRERLEKILKSKAKMPFIDTFHSLCFKILQDNSDRKDSVIIDEEDRKSIISDIIKNLTQEGVDVKIKPANACDWIVLAKQNILGTDHDFTETGLEIENDVKIFTQIYRRYQEILCTLNCYDYEDLIFNLVKIFEQDEKLCSKYSQIFRYIFVDEYQDLNQGQYRIIRALASENKDICVIGDPDQSIYGFRGSDVKYFNSFVKDYPDAKLIELTENYRSTDTILQACSQIIKDYTISGNKHRVYSGIDGVKTITTIYAGSEKSEAVAVGKIIEQLVGGTGFHSSDFGTLDNIDLSIERSFADFAILYRTNAQAQVFSDIFSKAGIPYQIAGRDNIFNNKNVRQIISLLKLAQGSGSFLDIQRVIQLPGFGIVKKAPLSKLRDWSYKKRFTLNQAISDISKFTDITKQERLNFNKLINQISKLAEHIKQFNLEQKLIYLIEKSGLKPDLEKDNKTKEVFEYLNRLAKESGEDSQGFFKAIALQTDTDIYEKMAEKVALMSMHAAKGLEFPVVFVVGCEDDYMPFRRSDNDDPDISEERRLFYVAMTRAREMLYLTHAKKRTIYGKTISRKVSPFLKDIEQSLLKQEFSDLKNKKKARQIQIEMF